MHLVSVSTYRILLSTSIKMGKKNVIPKKGSSYWGCRSNQCLLSVKKKKKITKNQHCPPFSAAAVFKFSLISGQSCFWNSNANHLWWVTAYILVSLIILISMHTSWMCYTTELWCRNQWRARDREREGERELQVTQALCSKEFGRKPTKEREQLAGGIPVFPVCLGDMFHTQGGGEWMFSGFDA